MGFLKGFFSPGSSESRYVGIWFGMSNETIVWVANRENPLKNYHGVLKVTNKGILVLLDSTNTTIWSSNISRTEKLLDSGNLVVKNGNISDPKTLLWQSFDYPSNSLLSSIKVGWDLEDKIMDRFGPWNSLHLMGVPWLMPNAWFNYEFVMNEKEIYFEYEVLNNSFILRYELNSLGIGQGFKWVDDTKSWELGITTQTHECEIYAHYGTYTSCNINKTTVCACLEGFIPKSPKENVKNCVCKVAHICKAYANLDIRNGGSGCLLWPTDLVDIVVLQVGGQDIYIRQAASKLGEGGFRSVYKVNNNLTN
ncbi:hypothetical protein ACJW30_01G352100 [Castanea mollissima]